MQADGGTRTPPSRVRCVALVDALAKLVAAAIGRSARYRYGGRHQRRIVDGRPVLDLSYEEDGKAGVDMNVVMTGRGRIVEIRGRRKAGRSAGKRCWP